MSALEITGGCDLCSRPRFGHVVLHGVPWCPRVPAATEVDTNMLWSGEIWVKRFTRPVGVGELVWMVDCGDGVERPFASWGRVEREYNGGFYLSAVGVTNNNGWVYASPDEEPTDA